jgi:signal transduction histidine kinase
MESELRYSIKRSNLNQIINLVFATLTGTYYPVTISVNDSGVGIPKENLAKVFKPFFTTKAKGQGLGLAVCKRLIEAQGGMISVNSEEGKGSTFTVKVPTTGPAGGSS